MGDVGGFDKLPRFAEPIAHDGDHRRPACTLRQSVQDPKYHVPWSAVDAAPFAHHTEQEQTQRGGDHADE